MPKTPRRKSVYAPAPRPLPTWVRVTANAEPAAVTALRWLDLDAEHDRLTVQEGMTESALADMEPDWLGWPEAERRAFPAAREYYETLERMSVVNAQREALLKTLPRTAATSVAAVVVNLSVVVRLLRQEDHPLERGMVARAVRDLGVVCAPGRAAAG